MKITETNKIKKIESENFNLGFNKETGLTVMYGETVDDDPDFCELGPVIADIEISTICNQGCPMCYKSNTCNGINMSFEHFKKIFHKFPRSLTQIAFGVTDLQIPKYYKKVKNNG